MRGKAEERARARRLMDNYKLTVEKYDKIYAYQRGVCYACGQPEPVKGRRLSVDHCHVTGLVRGLLCSRCNPILGKIERAFVRYGLTKVPGLSVAILLSCFSTYLKWPPSVYALETQHFGYIGRTNTKAHRARVRKEKKKTTPFTPLLYDTEDR
jgi:hypothetical protein